MRVLVAPDKFKGTLTAAEAARAIADGWRRSRPGDTVEQVPMADGGEGTLDALVEALSGSRRTVRVHGPLGDPVDAEYGVVRAAGRRTAVVEMARASGLQLLAPARRDARRTSTFGTGELIRAACDEGVDEVLVCIGGSATNDGGAGMASALGVRLLDASGSPIARGGAPLLDLATIDASGLDPAVARTRFVVATDVDNPLTGPYGASAVYGPQKGASTNDVLTLDRALAHLAAVVHRDLGIDVRDLRGGGAAGGLGAGLVVFLGARLRPGAELVMDAVGLRARLAHAGVAITGEGRLDEQSLHGKVVGAVTVAARTAGVRVIALCGDALIRPEGLEVAALVERFGRARALDDPTGALRELAAEIAMVPGPVSSAS